MRKLLVSLATALLLGGTFFAQDDPGGPQTRSPAGQASMPGQLPSGAVLVSELTKSIDAKKNKPGDRIEARVTMDLLAHGKIVVRSNTKIIGHVTDTKARTREAPDSMVAIVFDRVLLKDGRALALHATVQAIGRSLLASSTAGNGSLSETPVGIPGASAGGMGGIDRSGAGSAPTSLPGGAEGLPESGGSSSSAVVPLGPASHGVVGMRGLSLSTSPQGSAISSSSENVHLENGTQLVLRVSDQ